MAHVPKGVCKREDFGLDSHSGESIIIYMLINIFIALVLKQSTALSSATTCNTSKIGMKVENGVSLH